MSIVVLDRERRRLGAREDLELLDPRPRSRRSRAWGSRCRRASGPRRDADAPLAAQVAARGAWAVAVERRIEDDLGDALAVAQIDEHAAAVVAVGLDPAEQDDLLPRVARRAARRSCGSAYASPRIHSWNARDPSDFPRSTIGSRSRLLMDYLIPPNAADSIFEFLITDPTRRSNSSDSIENPHHCWLERTGELTCLTKENE